MSNPIVPGFEWRQAFDFPSGFLRATDGLRADFRPTHQSPEVQARISTNNGIAINGNRVIVTLTPAQTTKMKQFETVTNFVLIRELVETPIDVLIRIPVFMYPTRP